MVKKTVLSGIIFLCMISMAFAIPNQMNVHIRTKDNSDNVITGTFDFTLNITNSSNCSNSFYSYTTTKTTDSQGTTNIYLLNVTFPSNNQYYICLYRDGVLRNNSAIASVYSFYYSNMSDNLNPNNNYTIGQKLSFTYGDYLENSLDGWIKTNANLSYANQVFNLSGNNVFLTNSGYFVNMTGSNATIDKIAVGKPYPINYSVDTDSIGNTSGNLNIQGMADGDVYIANIADVDNNAVGTSLYICRKAPEFDRCARLYITASGGFSMEGDGNAKFQAGSSFGYFWINSPTSDIYLQMGDSEGIQKVRFFNSSQGTVAYVDSLGNGKFNGNLNATNYIGNASQLVGILGSQINNDLNWVNESYTNIVNGTANGQLGYWNGSIWKGDNDLLFENNKLTLKHTTTAYQIINNTDNILNSGDIVACSPVLEENDLSSYLGIVSTDLAWCMVSEDGGGRMSMNLMVGETPTTMSKLSGFDSVGRLYLLNADSTVASGLGIKTSNAWAYTGSFLVYMGEVDNCCGDKGNVLLIQNNESVTDGALLEARHGLSTVLYVGGRNGRGGGQFVGINTDNATKGISFEVIGNIRIDGDINHTGSINAESPLIECSGTVCKATDFENKFDTWCTKDLGEWNCDDCLLHADSCSKIYEKLSKNDILKELRNYNILVMDESNREIFDESINATVLKTEVKFRQIKSEDLIQGEPKKYNFGETIINVLVGKKDYNFKINEIITNKLYVYYNGEYIPLTQI